MKIKQIVFTKINTAELIEKDSLPIGEYDVAVKTSFSTISCGTEKANITGNPSVNAANPIPCVSFPRMLGYSSSGIVIEKGSKVDSVEIGDRVAVFCGFHQSIQVVSHKNVIKIDDDISLNEAAIGFISTFPLAAVRKTHLEIGESCIVMGLGTLGQLAVMFARASGAYPVIAVDPLEKRRSQAIKNGADYAFSPFDSDFVNKVKDITGGGVNAGIEVTGLGAGLDGILDCMAPLGRVSLLGCTRSSDFTIDYYRKVHFPGIQLIGAHTNARPINESYPGYFTHEDDIKATLRLCKGGRINLKDVIEEIHSPQNCHEVYTRLINEPDFPTFVQFDWSMM